MAFTVYSSNRLETLVDQLANLLTAAPAPPLTAEQIVVQHPGMGQWVQRKLAQHTGIAANLEFPLPGRFIGNLMEQVLETKVDLQLFDRDVLSWRIYQELPDFFKTPKGEPLTGYVSGEGAALKTYQLAATLGNLFDQYQMFRPDILQQWEEEEHDDWQATLWKHLAGDHLHRSACIHRTLQTLSQAPFHHHLPQQLYLFGLNSLAPVYLEILVTLGKHTRIHLFHLSPCQEYWGDTLSDRKLARQRGRRKQSEQDRDALYMERGNPLLTSLGSVAQDFQNQLLEYDLEEEENFSAHESATVLASLHNHILFMEDGEQAASEEKPALRDDGSLQFHICHSPLREVQVLHDTLLQLFTDIPDLTAGDVLVIAPDIQIYAQAVQGVFHSAPPDKQIPFSIRDQSIAGLSSTTQTYLDLLTTLAGKCGAPEVLSLLESGPLLARFNLSQADLPRIHRWISDSAIHWGMDREQREQLGMADYRQNSWQHGMDKLMLSYFLGSTEHSFNGCFPTAAVAVSEANLLGGLAAFIHRLRSWSHDISTPRSLAGWTKSLLEILHDFFLEDQDETGIMLIREYLETLSNQAELACCTRSMEFGVALHHLQQHLSVRPSGQVFLSGRVTFCNMIPMRSVPFRVIWLLGMHDGNFPRSGSSISFNLLQQKPRPGDRNRRNDDRYLFLETMLSARDCLSISWVGRSLQDNSETPPSTVVSELRDYINHSFKSPDHRRPSSCLTREYPLQPFSRHCFAADSPIQSYDRSWLPAPSKNSPPDFISSFTKDRTDPADMEIDLGRLVLFWKHPCRFFLEQELGMRLREQHILIEESEPFVLNGLDQYFLRNSLITDFLSGSSFEQIHSRLLDSGCLPQGAYGDIQLERINEESASFADAVAEQLVHPCAPMEIDTHIGPYHITGWLNSLYPAGRITWRSGGLKAAALMETWIYHLFLSRLDKIPISRTSIHYCRDNRIRLRAVEDADTLLREMLDLFIRGRQRPLPFFPESFLAGAPAKPEKKNSVIRSAWQGGYNRLGEGEDPAYRLIFNPHRVPPLEPEALELAALFEPIFAHRCDDAEA